MNHRFAKGQQLNVGVVGATGLVGTMIREILAELIGRGTLLGASGAGRDHFLLARDHYQEHLKDYLAPLGLERGVNSLWTDGGLLYAPPYR
mgnify:CR=1 FL=1